MVEEGPNYTVRDFIEEMRPFNLSYSQPKAISQIWVFWNQEEEEADAVSPQTQTTVISSPCGNSGSGTEKRTNNSNNNWRIGREYLKYALVNTEYNTKDSNILIQLWVPTITTSSTFEGERCVFTTSNQPFGLYRIERGLCEYRKHCTSLEFNCSTFYQDDEPGDGGGVIERVFRCKRKEATIAWESYTTKDQDHPPRNFAVKYGIRRSLLLPFFKPFGRCCAGVLELVDTCNTSFFFDDPHSLAKHIFKVGNLINPSPLHLPGIIEDRVIDEINKALQVVCTKHQLPLAHIWVPCCTTTALAYADNLDKSCYSSYLTCSDKFSSIYHECDMYNYNDVKNINLFFKHFNLRKGQGIVGKALLYRKPYFCADVTKLLVAEYPLSYVARAYGLAGCYAICIQSSIATGNHDYVLEFFLPPWNSNTILVNQMTFLELLLETVKNQLPGFKICSGSDSSVEVVGETAKVNVVIVTCLEKTVGGELVVEAATNDEIAKRLPPMLKSSLDEIELLQLSSDDESTVAVRKNKVNGAISTREKALEERGYRTTDISLSRDDLIKHFGKKLDDAAEILGVSRSTMKRACRVHGIKNWPFPKRKKVNPKHVNELVQCGNMQATAVVAHTIPNFTPKQDEGSVSVKATFGVEMIRFQLSLPSKKADLMEKVTLRLPLKDITFNIKYEDDAGDWVLIACDEDLEECIRISKGKSVIKMSVQSITNQAP